MPEPEVAERTAAPSLPAVVVKVGGSLFDLPDLDERLQRCLASLGNARSVIVPGGGPTADTVRAWDRCFRLGEERSHWLALRALSLNAQLLAELLPRAYLVRSLDEWLAGGRTGIVDMYEFARNDEGQEHCLPHVWQVTSDSLALRVAERLHAQRLILLKSVSVPRGMSCDEAARLGHVDAFFPTLAQRTALPIDVVNARQPLAAAAGPARCEIPSR